MIDSLLVQDLFAVRDKAVFLTGASGFLGRAMTRGLLANGARVIAVGKSPRFARFRDLIWAEFGRDRFSAYDADLFQLEAFQAVLENIVGREGPIDVIVNNAHAIGAAAGFNDVAGLLENASVDQITANLAGGALWPLLSVRILGRGMIERRSGSIINVASMYALVAPSPRLYQGTPFLNPPGYSMAKASMLALTRYVASFWGRYNVRCNALLPGAFPNTEERTENSVNEDDPFIQRLVERTSLNRAGTAPDLVGALLFLASNASSYVTGQALVVDGGWTIT